MPRFFAWIGFISRRRWLLVLSIGAVLLAVASPFLWAGYHAYAGERELKRYHSAEARAHFDACLRVWPWSRSGRLHLLAARAARRQGDFDEARRLLLECQHALHDDSSEAVLEWAMLRAVMGDLDAKAEPLRKAAHQNPSLVPLVLEALTEGYLTMSRIVDALHCTDDWLALEPNNAQAWFLRGKIHRQVGAAQEVAADCQRVLDLDPERADARWWLALALLDIGEYRKAYQHLQILQRQRPDDADLRVRMAMCLWRLDQEQDARHVLDRILAEHPHHGLALRTLGQISLTAGRFAEAEPWLSEAAHVLPYDYGAQNALWECLRQEGKAEEAETQRERKELLYERRQR
ncbi:MAG: tetratricopeptide repeat protein, partial [Gemmataceae bacterium]